MESKVTKLEVIKTPFCGELRSKKFYMRNEILLKAEDYHDGTGHTFCYHTHLPIGPDGYQVAPEYCGPERSCYRSALQEPEPYTPLPTKPKKIEDDNLEI